MAIGTSLGLACYCKTAGQRWRCGTRRRIDGELPRQQGVDRQRAQRQRSHNRRQSDQWVLLQTRANPSTILFRFQLPLVPAVPNHTYLATSTSQGSKMPAKCS